MLCSDISIRFAGSSTQVTQSYWWFYVLDSVQLFTALRLFDYWRVDGCIALPAVKNISYTSRCNSVWSFVFKHVDWLISLPLLLINLVTNLVLTRGKLSTQMISSLQEELPEMSSSTSKILGLPRPSLWDRYSCFFQLFHIWSSSSSSHSTLTQS